MADRKLYDYDGNEIPTTPVKKLYDYEGKPFQSPIPTDNTIGRHLVEALPMAGGMFGALLGPVGTAAGTGLGTVIKQGLQSARPDLLGGAPTGVAGIVGDLAKEEALNVGVPWALGKLGGGVAKVLRNLPVYREAVSSRMAQQIQQQLSPEVTNAGKFQLMPEYQPVGSHTPIEIKPTGLRGTQTIAKGPVVPSDLKLGEMVGTGGKSIDAAKTLDELTGLNAARYADSMSPELYSSTRDLLGTMKELQKKNTTDSIINYAKGRLVWTMGGAATGALFGHSGIGGSGWIGPERIPGYTKFNVRPHHAEFRDRETGHSGSPNSQGSTTSRPH